LHMPVERKIKILIVDDDVNMLYVIKSFLKLTDRYKVFTAKSGEIGLLFSSHHWQRPHLILLDIKMQGIDGYEVLRRIRSNRKTAYTPVIMITGLSDTASKIKAEGLYCDAYITKPFDLNLLKSTIEEIILKRGIA